MKYKCENELDTLNFQDFSIENVTYVSGKLSLYTNGGIARYNNSCNETFEERYISNCELIFNNIEIIKFYIGGYKYYDANDVLQKEIPDEEINKEDYVSKIKSFKGGNVFFMAGKCENNKYYAEIAIDVDEDTYWLNISSEKLIVGFDRFMNRVQN